jgi:hypothetical protein
MLNIGMVAAVGFTVGIIVAGVGFIAAPIAAGVGIPAAGAVGIKRKLPEGGVERRRIAAERG